MSKGKGKGKIKAKGTSKNKVESKQKWPFADPPNVATISLRDIMEGRAPILLVTHDAEDGMWQFLDGRDSPDEDDAVILGLDCVLSLDPSIGQLADLPLGWRAWRDSVKRPWKREPKQ